ncbi:glycerophosphodiester phosphodiesterase family protein [Paenibacillus sp. J2TS4]|uniref:glycerophosphodiester phosphodiesterase family protein n=1 Tax=Paenibacillus sp. J2TS4 TaxID=2807194 RepID=UPI001B08693D|nr:glycerophosphodiester phosphodiesterase family protein [Paenibacillus sp. J2TS4]GIP30993.1 hypothetical protein J2TS4_02030 [Paenibacillus sp. J2TS4]
MLIQSHLKINEKLQSRLQMKKPLIAVHRGSPGGIFIENTIPAYVAALRQGGDMIEADVILSTDGVLYTFHDGNEQRLCNEKTNIKQMSSAKIDSLKYFNTDYRIERFEAVLQFFKGDVLFNIDRAWDYWPEVLKLVDRFEMADQIILKSKVEEKHLRFLEACTTKYMYMPIVKTEEELALVKQYNINLVGVEFLAPTKDSLFLQEDYIRSIQQQGLFYWANAINFDDHTVLYAGYDDRTSIMEDPDKGWGVLLDKGVDIIQTDWPQLLSNYIQQRSCKKIDELT